MSTPVDIEALRPTASEQLAALKENHVKCGCPIGQLTEEDRAEIIQAILGPESS